MRTLMKLSLEAFLVCSLLAGGQGSLAQAGGGYTSDQIEQMVAPIALYPDSLLSQVLMASTYPTEIVMADRWVKANPGLKGSGFDEALSMQTWDPSVISLCKVPDVLSRMSQDLDWTTDLGNAFLAQKDDVMNAVQKLRNDAYAAGNLKTTSQQKVIVEKLVVQIVPTDPQIIYVPAYNPMVVYGPAWAYPVYYYPAVMVPPPYYVAGTAISFGIGMAVGAAMFGGCDWYHHNVYVNRNVFVNNNIYRNTNVTRNVVSNTNINRNINDQQNWQHDVNNRHNVPYRNDQLIRQYNRPAQGGLNRDAARGYGPSSAGAFENYSRPAGGQREKPGPGGSGLDSPPDRSITGQRQSTFGGYGSGDFEMQSSQRGAASRAQAGGYGRRR